MAFDNIPKKSGVSIVRVGYDAGYPDRNGCCVVFQDNLTMARMAFFSKWNLDGANFPFYVNSGWTGWAGWRQILGA